MTPLFKKLNYKNSSAIVSLNAPSSIENELKAMSEFATIIKDEEQVSVIDFAIVFVTQQTEIAKHMQKIFPKLNGDFVLWFCYPKGTSKKYTCNFNRDTGWDEIRKYNLDTVRQVAIDEDWSALRFRKNEYIKTAK